MAAAAAVGAERMMMVQFARDNFSSVKWAMEKGPERMRDDLVRLWAASSYQSAGELAEAAAWAVDPALAARGMPARRSIAEVWAMVPKRKRVRAAATSARQAESNCSRASGLRI